MKGRRAGGRPGPFPKADEGVPRGEAALHVLWRRQGSGAELPWSGGDPVRVLFPGWPNADRGPDFTGALLETGDGRQRRGDVELHVAGGDWYRHGHHRDPAYRGVILHVAGSGAAEERPTRHSAGGTVPVALLHGEEIGSPVAVSPDPRPCVRHAPTVHEDAIGAVLDQEGDRRFLEKSAAMAGAAAAEAPDEVLYGALLRGLGYAKNQRPFSELAQRLPYWKVSELLAPLSPSRRRPALEALFLGVAGLLPSQRGGAVSDGRYAARLEGAWQALGAGLLRVETPWQTFRVRPENAPVRRVAACVALLARWWPQGPVAALRGPLAHGGPREAPRALADALTCPSGGFWSAHWDLGRPGRATTALLGPGRAAEILVNVVLPFFHAWASSRGEEWLTQRCITLFRSHPPLPANGAVRAMEGVLLQERAGRTITTARRQQGLLGLYKRRCHALLCEGCSLGGRGPVATGYAALPEP